MITEWLAEKDKTLELHSEGEWSGMVGSDQWQAFNSGGIESETGEFLYGLIRLIKPDNVLETGSHKGIGGAYMAKALEDNDKGHLTTIEFLDELFTEASARFKTLELNHRIMAIYGDVRNFKPSDAGVEQYDLILLDTEPDQRFNEVLQFYPFLKPGGFMFIHDLHRHMSQVPMEGHDFGWPFGKIPDAMQELMASNKLRTMHFPTPRGLTGFYKEHEGDYDYRLS